MIGNDICEKKGWLNSLLNSYGENLFLQLVTKLRSDYLTAMIKSSVVISDKTEAIFNSIPPFDKLKILRNMGIHTNSSLSKSTLFIVIGKQCHGYMVCCYRKLENQLKGLN